MTTSSTASDTTLSEKNGSSEKPMSSTSTSQGAVVLVRIERMFAAKVVWRRAGRAEDELRVGGHVVDDLEHGAAFVGVEAGIIVVLEHDDVGGKVAAGDVRRRVGRDLVVAVGKHADRDALAGVTGSLHLVGMEDGQPLTGHRTRALAGLMGGQDRLDAGNPGGGHRLVERQGGAEHAVAFVGVPGGVFADDGQAEGGEIFFDGGSVHRAVEANVHDDVARGVHLRAGGFVADVRHQISAAL